VNGSPGAQTDAVAATCDVEAIAGEVLKERGL